MTRDFLSMLFGWTIFFGAIFLALMSWANRIKQDRKTGIWFRFKWFWIEWFTTKKRPKPKTYFFDEVGDKAFYFRKW